MAMSEKQAILKKSGKQHSVATVSVVWQNDSETIMWWSNVIKIVEKNQIESDVVYLCIYCKDVNVDGRDIMVMAPTKLQVAEGEIKALMYMKMQQIQFLKV